MSAASLNISVVEKRMLRLSEAASYLGFSVKSFGKFCPVRPIEVAKGENRFDRRDLDLWIDGLKDECAYQSRQSIVARLG